MSIQPEPNMSIQPEPNMSIQPAQSQPNMSIQPEPNQQFTPNPSVPPKVATPPCAVVSTVAESAPISTKKQPASSGQVGIIPRHPTDDKTVTSAFSPTRKHPITGKIQRHLGTDFRAPINAKFYAALDGEITYNVQYNKVTKKRDGKTGYGFYAYIKHTIYSTDPSASAKTFFTIYGHMKKDFPSQTVSQWQAKSKKKVKMGQVIGLSGNTGGSDGPHLHFEYNPNTSLFYASSTKKDPMTHFIGKTFYKS
jgi:murein DD-endopeptidase MepM/ murein hydrolase activator NlpD